MISHRGRASLSLGVVAGHLRGCGQLPVSLLGGLVAAASWRGL
ncbi:hypothetical protein [Nocardia sp.]|nr:hypothetical protein [Nocardia sp.]